LALSDAGAIFGGVLVLTFGLTVLLSGLFSSYFGAGKSRKIGMGLVIVGLLTMFAWTTITFGIEVFITFEAWNAEQMGNGVAALLAGMLGGLVGLTLFLIAIMRA
jgi:hypothetical protein